MKTPIKGKIWHINADSEVVDLTSQIAVSKPSVCYPSLALITFFFSLSLSLEKSHFVMN